MKEDEGRRNIEIEKLEIDALLIIRCYDSHGHAIRRFIVVAKGVRHKVDGGS